ncbi:YceD family protein [Ancylobacter sp. G4_0304]|uniref:YceD family protein n=1 Tax=Ancylobacter sp. G4_0304 TaxID=3114289 RepID=UPI0039C6C7C8
MSQASEPHTSPLSQPVLVASLPDTGSTFRVEPDEAARAALAREFGIPAISAFKAKVTLVPGSRGCVRAEGRVEAVVRQVCVVTLEEFDTSVSEEIDVTFAPEDQLPEIRPGAEIDVSELDLPDPLVDGTVDVGAVAAEFLALALDPYPRKPGAEFKRVEELPDEQLSPFAALAKLRDGDKE